MSKVSITINVIVTVVHQTQREARMGGGGQGGREGHTVIIPHIWAAILREIKVEFPQTVNLLVGGFATSSGVHQLEVRFVQVLWSIYD